MSDDRLREAERAFRETGAVAEEARLLSERVRAGEIARERLELAAELRYEAAVVAVGVPRGLRSHSLREVTGSLERFGREVGVRAALIVARRCTALIPELGRTGECLAAVEAWLECPCDRHAQDLEMAQASNVHPDARLAAQAVVAHHSGEAGEHAHYPGIGPQVPHAPDAAIVFAVRDGLARWALAPHEPVARRAPAPGALLELRVGRSDHPGLESRLLVSRERLRVGRTDDCTVHIDCAAIAFVEIERTADGFVLGNAWPGPEPAQLVVGAYLNDDVARGGPLASGDVIALDRSWVELEVLAPPFDHDVERARADAARLLADPANGRGVQGIALAAAAGDLGAMLAATELGVVLKPRPRFDDWVVTLAALPDELLNPILAGLAREARAIPASYIPKDLAFDRVLDAVVAWLEAPSAEARGAAEALERKLDRALALRARDRTETRTRRGVIPELAPGEARAQGAKALAQASLRGAGAEDRLLGSVRGALDAQVTRERMRALISAELLRWAKSD